MIVPYKNMMERGARLALTRQPIIPDARLMIESAEVQESIPILIFKNYYPAEVQPIVNSTSGMTAEQIENAIAEGNLEPNDFINNTYVIGSAL